MNKLGHRSIARYLSILTLAMFALVEARLVWEVVRYISPTFQLMYWHVGVLIAFAFLIVSGLVNNSLISGAIAWVGVALCASLGGGVEILIMAIAFNLGLPIALTMGWYIYDFLSEKLAKGCNEPSN